MRRLLVLFAALILPSVAAAARLPVDVVPRSYALTLTPNLEEASFRGDEVIRVELRKSSQVITLHSVGLTIDSASVVASSGRAQKASVSTDSDNQTISLHTRRPVIAGDTRIRIRFRGKLNTELRGLYLSTEGERRYAVTQFEATDARRAFPCFDEPALKAKFDITVIADRGHSVIGNTRIVSDKRGPGAKKHTVHFATTPELPTYLVALAIGDFACREGGVDGIPIRICSTPDKLSQTGTALRWAERLVHWFDSYFATKYPFEKLDVVAIPDFSAGAMENAAAIFYREPLLLTGEKNVSPETEATIATVLSHEIAHQWFGDLVTMRWWDDLWLNEGFATWMETKPVAALQPGWKLDLYDVRETRQSVNRDLLLGERPVRTKAESPEEINALFDSVAYGKTAALLRMVEAYTGPEAFRSGINTYLQRFAWSNATGEDFWNTMTEVTKKPVDAVMRDFVDLRGAPVVSSTASCRDGKGAVTLSQVRAATTGPGPASVWHVPVCYRYPGGAAQSECTIVADAPVTVSLPTCAPVVLNPGGVGYHVTRYSPEESARLRENLEELSPGERIALLGDTWSLVGAGQEKISTFMSLATEAMRGDADPSVVALVSEKAGYVGEYLVTDATRPSFRKWIETLFSPYGASLGWATRQGDSAERKGLRATVFGRLGESAADPEVIARALELTKQTMTSGFVEDRSLLRRAISVAASNGDEKLYDALVEAIGNARGAEQRFGLMTALASFRQPALVERTLTLTLSPEVRPANRANAFAIEMSDSKTRKIAWEFAKRHWNEVGWLPNADRVLEAMGTACDPEERADFASFVEKNASDELQPFVTPALRAIDRCIAFRSQQQASFDEWLRSFR